MNGLHLSSGQVYDRDHAILKTYGPDLCRVLLMRSCRLPGFEEQGGGRGKRNSAGNEAKLDASLSRTRSRIFELAMCNPWEYFVTLTLSPDHGDRQDLGAFKRSLSKWLNNLNSRKGCSIRYLLIPEPHADGSWHMHGLFMGVPPEMLRPFSRSEFLPYNLLAVLDQGRQLYDWPAYRQKFGYVTCEPIRDREACAKYVTKYITKDLGKRAAQLNEKLYLCSLGLERAQVACRGHLVQPFTPDFCNDYVAAKTFASLEEAQALFVEGNISGPAPVGFWDVADRHPKGGAPWNN